MGIVYSTRGVVGLLVVGFLVEGVVVGDKVVVGKRVGVPVITGFFVGAADVGVFVVDVGGLTILYAIAKFSGFFHDFATESCMSISVML